MSVKVLIERQVKLGHRAEVEGLLIKLRSKALTQPGYLSGETLVDLGAPLRLVVISRWDDVSHWEAWRRHPDRVAISAKIQPLLSAPARETVLLESIAEHTAGP